MTEENKEKKDFDIIDMIDPIEKVFGAQSGRVVKDFNIFATKSMRVTPIVTAMVTIQNYKLLKEIRDLLINLNNVNGDGVEEEAKKPTGKKKIDLK